MAGVILKRFSAEGSRVHRKKPVPLHARCFGPEGPQHDASQKEAPVQGKPTYLLAAS